MDSVFGMSTNDRCPVCSDEWCSDWMERGKPCVPSIGDRVTFPVSCASAHRYHGKLVAIRNGLAYVEVDGYRGHRSATRIGLLKLEVKSEPVDPRECDDDLLHDDRPL